MGHGHDRAAGLPAVRLKQLAALARFDALSDIEMVRQQRRLLMDPAAPNPSVEAILHAVIPAQHVDHTHANDIVALTDQPDGEALARELFPDAILVPYVMPGFDLAKACAKAIAAAPRATSMILMKHGIFTWSDDGSRKLRGDDRARRSRRAPAGAGAGAAVHAGATTVQPCLAGRDHADPERPSGAAH